MRRLQGLYAIVDSRRVEDPEEAARAVLPHCSVLQLRCKGFPQAQVEGWAHALAQACVEHGALFVLNDFVEIAAAIPEAAVHLGQEDMHPRAARAILGPERIVGLSTRSLPQLAQAMGWGVDYVGFGPVLDTGSKGEELKGLGLAALADAVASVPLPVVAIGGLGLEQMAQVAATGACAAAVIGALWEEGPSSERAQALAKSFAAGRPGGQRSA